MARARREREWGRIPTSVLETFEAVHPAVADVVAAQAQQLDSVIGWAGPGADVDDTPEVRASVERVGVAPTSAKVVYGRAHPVGTSRKIVLDAEGPLSNVEMSVWNRTYGDRGTVVSLKVEGDDVDTTHGFFNSASNRIDAAVKRLKEPASVTGAGAQASGPKGPRGWVSSLLQHPTGSQIVGGLVVAGILALITTWWASQR